MARLFRDLKVNEQDGKVYLTLYNRDGSPALRDVSVGVSSEVTQPGDNWTAAAANLLLRLDEDGQPQLALTPESIGAAAAENGVSLYTHKKSGTVHTLTGSGNNIRFAATASFAAGDTIQVNGQACTAATAAGDALWAGFFKTGAMVVCYRTGNRLTFNGGGLPAAEAAKLAPGNLKTGVSITANGKTVTGTFTADATADAGKILSGATAYVKGQKVTGSMADRGNAQYGTGVGFGSDYVAINNIPEGYYRKNGLVWAPEARIAQSTMAAAIGLNSQNLRQGVTILGVQGDLVPRTPVAYAACSRVLGLLPGTTGDYRHPTKASGYADPDYGSLSGLGYFQDNQSGTRQVVWQCARAGRYLVELFGDGEVSVRGEVQLSAGQTVTLTIPDAGDIYWRDMKCGGMVILYLP